jgi:hypothetical protein
LTGQIRNILIKILVVKALADNNILKEWLHKPGKTLAVPVKKLCNRLITDFTDGFLPWVLAGFSCRGFAERASSKHPA